MSHVAWWSSCVSVCAYRNTRLYISQGPLRPQSGRIQWPNYVQLMYRVAHRPNMFQTGSNG